MVRAAALVALLGLSACSPPTTFESTKTIAQEVGLCRVDALKVLGASNDPFQAHEENYVSACMAGKRFERRANCSNLEPSCWLPART